MDQFKDIMLWLETHTILLVLGVFITIVATTYWPGRKSRIERNGLIPLQD